MEDAVAERHDERIAVENLPIRRFVVEEWRMRGTSSPRVKTR
jgi:hypothetical protein